MAKLTLILAITVSMLNATAASKTIKFSGTELSFKEITTFFRHELRKVKPQSLNFFVKLKNQKQKTFDSKKFSINFDGLTLNQALKSFASTNNLSVTQEGRVVILSDSSKMQTKVHYVLTDFNDYLKKGKSGKASAKSTMTFLKSIGVKFPKGSKANYSLNRNIIIMTNTPSNQDQLRQSLRGVGLLYK